MDQVKGGKDWVLSCGKWWLENGDNCTCTTIFKRRKIIKKKKVLSWKLPPQNNNVYMCYVYITRKPKSEDSPSSILAVFVREQFRRETKTYSGIEIENLFMKYTEAWNYRLMQSPASSVFGIVAETRQIHMDYWVLWRKKDSTATLSKGACQPLLWQAFIGLIFIRTQGMNSLSIIVRQ